MYGPMTAFGVKKEVKTKMRPDIFGFDRLQSRTCTTAQIDTQWTVAMYEDFIRWFETDPRAEEYRHFHWDAELEEARKKEAAPDPWRRPADE